MYPILATAERACAEFAASASVSASLDCFIYTGMDSENKMAPAIICNAYEAVEDFPESGVWHVRTNIMVKEMAADTSLTSSLANTIFGAFSNMTPSELQSTVSNFAVYDISLEGCSNTQDEDAWVQTLSLDIVGVLT